MENTPLVVDGVLYTGTHTEIVALDAVTGRPYWKFDRPLDPNAYYNAYRSTRDMAIAGDTLFWATLDCHSGLRRQDRAHHLGQGTMAEWQKGYQYNVAPLIVRNMIILGPATNEAGSNCWVKRTTSRPERRSGDSTRRPCRRISRKPRPGRATPGNTAATRSGMAVPTIRRRTSRSGAPGIRIRDGTAIRARRETTCTPTSVIALDADTGKLKWYYQFTPGDEYDWDSTQVPVLVNMDWKGQQRKVMLWANRNGFFYVLDRTTGKFLFGKNFVKQNWNLGFDEVGRPIKDPARWPKPMGGILIEPGNQGGTNWYPPSYSPQTGLFYIPTWENSGGRSRREIRAPGWKASDTPATGSGGAVHKGRPRRSGETAAPPQRQAAAGGAAAGPSPITRRRTKGTARFVPSTRKPARRSGTSRW